MCSDVVCYSLGVDFPAATSEGSERLTAIATFAQEAVETIIVITTLASCSWVVTSEVYLIRFQGLALSFFKSC